ncbi:hypothetical protein [Halobellus inordinatus]|uniref:hypothetical protein n=1 Tax=Halobellus inordinatus TaxID=1126236 RepID=UPI0021157DF2|nr:hypothetical protein [Halobellus ramosii]
MELPVAVVEAVSDMWPASKPLGVSLPVVDANSGGLKLNTAFEVVSQLETAGCDVVVPIDAATGSRAVDQKGASDFSDDIRNETGVQTIATAATSSLDKINTLVATGRADLSTFTRMPPEM